MKKATLSKIREHFRMFNKENGISYGDYNVPEITAVIVYEQSNFDKPYTETERSYRISNLCGKAFFDLPSGSNSMTGDCLDGKDLGVRLDAYNWKIKYCYFE